MTGTTHDPVTARPATPDEVWDVLVEWVPAQRWFPAKGSAGRPEPHAVLELPDPAGEAEVSVRLLRVPGGGVLQVPLVLRDGGDHEHAIGSVGTVGTPGARLVVDGSHDPAFARAWLAAATWDRPGDQGDPARSVEGLRVAAGEQSNTSVLLPSAAVPGILKVFRTLSAGPSPDVEVPLALSHDGWTGVPRPLAWLAGTWPAPDGGAPLVGHLGVLSELVEGAEDGFRLACRYAAAGDDLDALAADLGRTTAQMHRALRSALPLDDPAGSAAADDVAATVLTTLRERAAAAVAAAPVLADRADAVDAVLARVGGLGALPALQRVHGDYHLGQVLHSGRGWSVLDFEGEPMASATERTRPDLALRDLAGMLRSVDYAAAVGEPRSPDWAARARDRLVEGYRAEAGHELPDEVVAPLLRALELDKALYEVVYEVRNRPAWVDIPLRAVDRLVAD